MGSQALEILIVSPVTSDMTDHNCEDQRFMVCLTGQILSSHRTQTLDLSNVSYVQSMCYIVNGLN